MGRFYRRGPWMRPRFPRRLPHWPPIWRRGPFPLGRRRWFGPLGCGLSLFPVLFLIGLLFIGFLMRMIG